MLLAALVSSYLNEGILRLHPRYGSPTARAPGPNTKGQVENITDREIVAAINAVAPHPTDANIVCVGAVNGGIWKTGNAMAGSANLRDLQALLPLPRSPRRPTTSQSLCHYHSPQFRLLFVGFRDLQGNRVEREPIIRRRRGNTRPLVWHYPQDRRRQAG